MKALAKFLLGLGLVFVAVPWTIGDIAVALLSVVFRLSAGHPRQEVFNVLLCLMRAYNDLRFIYLAQLFPGLVACPCNSCRGSRTQQGRPAEASETQVRH